jgi:D-inositol-3-phosphate glycosyltransferase
MNAMYRLAFISAHTCPLAKLGSGEAGGMNVYVRKLSEELARRGFRVDIFTRRADQDSPETIALAEGLRVVHIEAGPAQPLPKEEMPRYLEAFEESLLRFQRERNLNYSLLHSHYWLSGWVAERLKLRWRVPHVAMFHTLGEVKNQARITEREPPFRIETERAIVQGADRIVCASEHERQLLVELYGARSHRIAVVPCGVDLDLFQPMDKEEARRRLGLRDHERIILFVGRIEPLKGVDLLIGAAAQLHGQEDFYLLIVGGDSRVPSEMAHLQRLARGLGIDHHVSFVGPVDQERLPVFYNAADVCVVPSFYESFGLVAVEAMACGTPVVASRVGGLTATVRDGETGYLVPWHRAEPLAERLGLLLGNEDLRRTLGRAAREQMYPFRWASVAEGVIKVYRELLEVPAMTPADPCGCLAAAPPCPSE